MTLNMSNKFKPGDRVRLTATFELCLGSETNLVADIECGLSRLIASAIFEFSKAKNAAVIDGTFVLIAETKNV